MGHIYPLYRLVRVNYSYIYTNIDGFGLPVKNVLEARMFQPSNSSFTFSTCGLCGRNPEETPVGK